MAIERRGKVQTEVTVTGEDRYARDLKKAENSLDRLRDGAKDLDSVFRDLGGGSAVAAAAIGAVIAEVEVATRVYGALWDAGEALIEQYGRLGERGGAVAAVAGYYEQIADQGLLNRLQMLAGWHVRQQTIMETFNTTIRAGIVSQEAFVEFFQRTVAGAQGAGKDIEATWRSVATALTGGGTEVFLQLGVNIQEVNEQLRRMGLSGETVAGKTAALGLVMEQLREVTGEADNAATNLSDTWEATTTQASDFYDQVARIVSTSPAAVSAFEVFREKLFGIDGAATAAGEAIAEMGRTTIIMLAQMVESGAQAAGWMSQMALQVASIFPDVEDVPSFMRRSLERVEEIRQLHRGVIEVSGEIEAAAFAARRAALAAAAVAPAGAGAQQPIVPRMPGGRGAGAAARERETAFEILGINEMNLEALGRMDELSRARTESDTLLLGITETQIGLEQELAAAEQERQEAWLRRVEAIGAAHEKAIQWEQRNAAAAVEAAQARQAALMENLSTAAQTVSTIGGIFDMIAQSQEAAGRSTEAAYKAKGTMMGIENTILAIQAGAEAVGAFASLNIIGGLAYTAKAASHTAAAVMAFTQLAKGSGAGAGAGAAAAATSPGTFIPARTDTMTGPQRPAGGGNTYQIFTMGGSDLARQVGRAEYQLQRSGQFAQAPSQGIRFTG